MGDEAQIDRTEMYLIDGGLRRLLPIHVIDQQPAQVVSADLHTSSMTPLQHPTHEATLALQSGLTSYSFSPVSHLHTLIACMPPSAFIYPHALVCPLCPPYSPSRCCLPCPPLFPFPSYCAISAPVQLPELLLDRIPLLTCATGHSHGDALHRPHWATDVVCTSHHISHHIQGSVY